MNTVYASDWILHATAGGLLGGYFHPIIAFIVGIITHGILDVFVDEYMPYPFMKYWWWFSIQVIVVVILIMISPINMVFGILGSITPDIVDGIYGFSTKKKGGLNIPSSFTKKGYNAWVKNSNWNAGKLLCPFHKASALRVTYTLMLIENIMICGIALLIYIIDLFSKEL